VNVMMALWRGRRGSAAWKVIGGWALAGWVLCAQLAVAGTYTKEHAFKGLADGGRPYGAVVDEAGNIYGETLVGGDDCPEPGGTSGCGVVYTIEPGGKLTTLATFTGTSNGAIGDSKLSLNDHVLYGSTQAGGAANDGVVFSLKTNGSDFTVLHQFSGSDGSWPGGNLVIDAQGDVFGTTLQGGAANDGVLFEIRPDGTFAILYEFNINVEGSFNGLVSDNHGDLFGSNSGQIFEFVPGTGVMTVLYTLTAAQGTYPRLGGVHRRILYGYAQNAIASSNPYGSLFQLKLSTGYPFTTLHSFTDSGEGANPAGLTVTSTGTLVGVTAAGLMDGKHVGAGTIFSFSGSTLTTLFSFANEYTGSPPNSSPFVSSSGTIYGTTANGGTACTQQQPGCGVTFSYAP
jgi:uncharacterized repeat protein (TIGR03803 family)